MTDYLPGSAAPQVRVTLPGGRVTVGPLLRWRQDQQTGAWFADVAVSVPAAAVQQVSGEDYTSVPREPTAPRYVLSVDTRLTPPTMELHVDGCWVIAEPAAWRRITPCPDLRLVLRSDGTACTACCDQHLTDLPPRNSRHGSRPAPEQGIEP